MSFTESIVENAALAWLETLSYVRAIGPSIAYGEPKAERVTADFSDVLLEGRIRKALILLNTDLPMDAIEDAYRKLRRVSGPSLLARNRAFHRMLIDGVPVEYRTDKGEIRGAQVRVIDFDHPKENDWVAVNQFTAVENKHNRRPDIVIFVNGIPLAVIELKNAADENATIWSAYQQLQTYQDEIPSLFTYNAALLISDGVECRIGALGAGKEWFTWLDRSEVRVA